MSSGRLLITAVLIAAVLCATGALNSCKSTSPTPAAAAPADGGETLWVNANGLRLKTKIYYNPSAGDHPSPGPVDRVLLVVLHGDLLPQGQAPSYQYVFAGMAANKISNVVVAALLRPGYADDVNDRSGGERGLRTGDNYTPEVVEAVSQAIRELRMKLQPRATVLAGHSGGAAIAADLLGLHPSDINGALLVSCPCDVPVWRKHMARHEFGEVGPFSLLFLAPVRSLSPVDLADKVLPSTRVRMVVGSKDPVAPPDLTQEYAEALRKHGADVTVTIVPGLGHEILLEPVVLQQLKGLVETVGAGLHATLR